MSAHQEFLPYAEPLILKNLNIKSGFVSYEIAKTGEAILVPNIWYNRPVIENLRSQRSAPAVVSLIEGFVGIVQDPLFKHTDLRQTAKNYLARHTSGIVKIDDSEAYIKLKPTKLPYLFKGDTAFGDLYIKLQAFIDSLGLPKISYWHKSQGTFECNVSIYDFIEVLGVDIDDFQQTVQAVFDIDNGKLIKEAVLQPIIVKYNMYEQSQYGNKWLVSLKK